MVPVHRWWPFRFPATLTTATTHKLSANQHADALDPLLLSASLLFFRPLKSRQTTSGPKRPAERASTVLQAISHLQSQDIAAADGLLSLLGLRFRLCSQAFLAEWPACLSSREYDDDGEGAAVMSELSTINVSHSDMIHSLCSIAWMPSNLLSQDVQLAVSLHMAQPCALGALDNSIEPE